MLIAACSTVAHGLEQQRFEGLLHPRPISVGQLFTVHPWRQAGPDEHAAYILYLAYKQWTGSGVSSGAVVAVEGGRSLFGKGLLTGFSNPKAIIMFSAVFPQFAGAGEHNSMTDIAILGLTFLVLQFASGCLYGYLGQRIKPVLEAPRRRVWLQRVTALLLLGVVGMLARGFSD